MSASNDLIRYLALCRPHPSAHADKHDIISSLLTRRGDPLADKYKEHTVKIMGKAHKLTIGKRIRLTCDADYEVQVHAENVEGQTFLLVAVTDVSFGVHHSIAEVFDTWRALVLRAFPASDAAAPKGALAGRAHDILEQIKAKYNTSSLQETNRKVEEVKGVMRDNVDLAIANAPKLDEIDERSADIEASSRVYHQKSKKLKWAMCREYWKAIVLIALILIIIIVIIVVVVTQ